jgi:glycerol-3-phosphate O-acyltransferase/dihydroxyacetone phosphate acyltransferase
LNPVLYAIYYLLKWTVHFAVWAFYRKITVTGHRHEHSHNPCIIVSNHPSTLLDPLNVAVESNVEIYFLANASLFRNPFISWLLRKLYCIPIERYQDTGGKPLDNAASFEQAENHLTEGGCIYVAPEGSSYVERRLRKIKTGTARIALAAMQRSGWTANISILPIGLNYSDPTRYRSELLTIHGEYIPVAQFREDYEADPVNAVYCLTEAIGEGIGQLIIDSEDGHQDELLHRLETIVQNAHPLPPLEAHDRSRKVLAHLKDWKVGNPADYEAFSQGVFAYFEKIKALKISDLQVAEQQSGTNAIPLLLTLPLFVPGYLSHVLPCFFTKKITDALNGDFHWVPTYKFAAGVVMYPLFIWLQVWLVGLVAEHFGLGVWVKWAYLAAVIPLGLVAEWWLRTGNRWLQEQRSAALRSKVGNEWESLLKERREILDKIKLIDV